MSRWARLRPLLAISLMVLILSMGACAFLASDEGAGLQTAVGEPKPVRYATVLATLRSAERTQLESAVAFGTKFMLSGLSEDSDMQILHFKWTESRVDRDAQGLKNVTPISTTFSLRATPVILFRYEAVNENDSAKDYDGVGTVTYSPDWKTIIEFDF